MHELGMAEGIVNTVLQSAEHTGAQSVVSVHIKVGEHVAAELDSLRFCFGILSQRTIADGAVLEVEVVPLVANCSACDKSFVPEGPRAKCPICGSEEVAVTDGHELYVDSIQVR